MNCLTKQPCGPKSFIEWDHRGLPGSHAEADREASPLSCLAEPDNPERIGSECWLSISISIRAIRETPTSRWIPFHCMNPARIPFLKSQTLVSAFGSRDCTDPPRKVGGYLENTLD